MSQPEESRPKTTETDDVLLRPGGDPDRRTDQVAPRDEADQGEVWVEREGGLTPVDRTQDRPAAG